MNLKKRKPIIPPIILRITSPTSQIPKAKRYWIDSIKKLKKKLKIKTFLNEDIFLKNKGTSTPNGINNKIFPAIFLISKYQ